MYIYINLYSECLRIKNEKLKTVKLCPWLQMNETHKEGKKSDHFINY